MFAFQFFHAHKQSTFYYYYYYLYYAPRMKSIYFIFVEEIVYTKDSKCTPLCGKEKMKEIIYGSCCRRNKYLQTPKKTKKNMNSKQFKFRNMNTHVAIDEKK